MFAKSGITPWWEMFEIEIKAGDKQIRTRCGANSLSSGHLCFIVPVTQGTSELVETRAPAEIHYDGTKYRVYGYSIRHGYAEFRGEPVGSAAKPAIQDQILGVLRASPNGMTARQIGDALRFTSRWVFTALAPLTKAGQVTKEGALYRAGD
jgi:hypothetical protein